MITEKLNARCIDTLEIGTVPIATNVLDRMGEKQKWKFFTNC